MNLYLLIKTLHILSATVLFGTGMGIAFFMLRSWYVDDPQQRLYAARTTVLADWLFTLPAGILQPVTGFWLIWQAHFPLTDLWIVTSLILYGIAGMCWLPVVWIQLRLKNLLEISVQTGTPLPQDYHRLFRYWFALGWPAFASLMMIFYLMVAKPS